MNVAFKIDDYLQYVNEIKDERNKAMFELNMSIFVETSLYSICARHIGLRSTMWHE